MLVSWRVYPGYVITSNMTPSASTVVAGAKAPCTGVGWIWWLCQELMGT